MDYLITKYGRGKFLNYVKSLMRDNDHARVFIDVYSLDYKTFLIEFRSRVSNNS